MFPFPDIDVRITHTDKIVQTEAETRVHKAITDPSELAMHRKIMERTSRNGKYELQKLKQDSIHLTFAVYSREGSDCLLEDIRSGALGKILPGIFLSNETLARVEEVSFDVEASATALADAVKYFDRVGEIIYTFHG